MRLLAAFFLGVLALPALAAEPPKMCDPDWSERHQGDCWVEESVFEGKKALAYVHPRGWVVDRRCFSDARFPAAAMNAALETAYRKMRPQKSVGRDGCLSEFNPEWGRQLVQAIWRKNMYISCPAYDAGSDTCAHRSSRDKSFQGADGTFRQIPEYYNLLTLENVARCTAAGGSGLAGVIFHESLHAAGADNFSTNKHNTAWNLPQYEFVGDRVYAAEAVCFFAHDPENRKFVNFIQCKRVVEHDASAPRLKLCEGFDMSFTDSPPPGFIKH